MPTGKVSLIRSLLFIVLTSVTQGCGIYSFNPTSKAPDIHTVTVQYFPNQAAIIVPTLSQTFTEKLKNKFISETTLDVVPADGDLNFSGRITNYFTAPTAMQGDQTAAKNRLTMTVEVQFINKKDEKQN